MRSITMVANALVATRTTVSPHSPRLRRFSHGHARRVTVPGGVSQDRMLPCDFENGFMLQGLQISCRMHSTASLCLYLYNVDS